MKYNNTITKSNSMPKSLVLLILDNSNSIEQDLLLEYIFSDQANMRSKKKKNILMQLLKLLVAAIKNIEGI